MLYLSNRRLNITKMRSNIQEECCFEGSNAYSLGVRLIIEAVDPAECSCLGINGCHLCLSLFHVVEAM